MNALFDYLLKIDKYGYFIDNNCNYLFKYNIENDKLEKKWELLSDSKKWHQFSGIDSIDNTLVIYPMWSEKIILFKEYDSYESIDYFDISDIANNDLYPMYLKNRTIDNIYAFKAKEFGIYKMNLNKKESKRLEFNDKIEAMMKSMEKGFQHIIVKENLAFFLPANPSEFVVSFSGEDEKIALIEPQIGKIIQFALKNDLFWFLTDTNEIVGWSESEGVVVRKRLKSDKKLDNNYENEFQIIICEEGVLVLGLYNNGSMLLIRDKDFSTIITNYNNFIKNCEDNIEINNCKKEIAYSNGERQFLQLNDGSFWLGEKMEYHKPIDIGIKVMNGLIMKEGRNNSMQDFLWKIQNG